jgi:hypothetical protein
MEELINNDKVFLIISFAKLAAIIAIIAHFLACYFWFIGKQELANNEIGWIRQAGIEDAHVDL